MARIIVNERVITIDIEVETAQLYTAVSLLAKLLSTLQELQVLQMRGDVRILLPTERKD